jgi:hypothetical protein
LLTPAPSAAAAASVHGDRHAEMKASSSSAALRRGILTLWEDRRSVCSIGVRCACSYTAMQGSSADDQVGSHACRLDALPSLIGDFDKDNGNSLSFSMPRSYAWSSIRA